MILNLLEQKRIDYPNTSEEYRFIDFVQKPIEIYLFVDPLCPKCWSLEPYLRKLSVEYGRFFTIRPVVINRFPKTVSHKHSQTFKHAVARKNISHLRSHLPDGTFSNPSISIAIKAAELQGKNAGRNFLRKIQEHFFLKKEDISDQTILMKCAADAKLDMMEFHKDLNSVSAQKAFQCDLKITNEMGVHDTPTLVVFSQFVEDQGVKITGLNSYDMYVLLLKKMLQRNPMPSKKPPIEDFLAYYDVVHNAELAIVYDMSPVEIEHVMKKLQLKQTVKKILKNNDTFWKYNKNV